MSWVEMSLNTTPEAIDWIRTLLAEAQYTGEVCITNHFESESDQSAQTSSSHTSGTWSFTVYLYLPYTSRTRETVETIERLLSPLQRTGLTTALETAIVEEKPEETATASFHRIGQRFVVLSPNTPYQSGTKTEIPIRLGSNFSFGSGLHPATIVCLRLLEQHLLPDMTVLDLGSGSGILSVAAAKLGAKVLAVDNDSVAVQATQDAIHLNNVEQQVTVMKGSLGQGSTLGHWMGGTIDAVPCIDASTRFDLIVANILARIHIALAPDFRQSLRHTDKKRGLLITSGFTTDQEEAVSTAIMEAGFEAIDRSPLDEWVALAFQLVG